jgi:hypothetical protein
MEAQLILATIAQRFRLEQLNEARPNSEVGLCRTGPHAVAPGGNLNLTI